MLELPPFSLNYRVKPDNLGHFGLPRKQPKILQTASSVTLRTCYISRLCFDWKSMLQSKILLKIWTFRPLPHSDNTFRYVCFFKWLNQCTNVIHSLSYYCSLTINLKRSCNFSAIFCLFPLCHTVYNGHSCITLMANFGLLGLSWTYHP